jgi:DNA polymerase-4
MFLAKLASDLEKPDGLVVVPADDVQGFLDPLPVKRLWGAGKVTLKRFEEIGLRTFGDVRALVLEELRGHFGDVGEHFYRLVRGIDDREVTPDHEAKSISHEDTFATDIDDAEQLRTILLHQTEQVASRLRRHGRMARTVTVKIRTGDFRTVTRSVTLNAATDCTERVWEAAGALFETWARAQFAAVRLTGVGVSHLSDGSGRQLPLFGVEDEARTRSLDRTLDEIRERYGHDAISRGGAGGASRQARRSGGGESERRGR